MGKKGGGSQTTQTTQSADPWVGVQPYLAQNYGLASSQIGQPTTPNTNYAQIAARDAILGKALGAPNQGIAQAGASASNFMNGAGFRDNIFANGLAFKNDAWANGTVGAADRYSKGTGLAGNATAQGAYLSPGSNPYMRQMVEAAQRPIVENFQEAIAPALASQFSAAGRTGSGSHVAAFDQSARSLGRQLSDTSGQLYGQAYQQERGLMENASEAERQRMYNAYEGNRQLQFNAAQYNKQANQAGFEAERGRQFGAIGMAPSLASADWQGLDRAYQVGQDMYGEDQARLRAPMEQLSWYNNILNGAAPYASSSGSSTQNLPKANPYTTAIGGGLSGYALGAMTGLGGPLGGMIGAGLGLFG